MEIERVRNRIPKTVWATLLSVVLLTAMGTHVMLSRPHAQQASCDYDGL